MVNFLKRLFSQVRFTDHVNFTASSTTSEVQKKRPEGDMKASILSNPSFIELRMPLEPVPARHGDTVVGIFLSAMLFLEILEGSRIKKRVKFVQTETNQ